MWRLTLVVRHVPVIACTQSLFSAAALEQTNEGRGLRTAGPARLRQQQVRERVIVHAGDG
eukprot:COSAG04_NODE_27379_length_283_cov_1.891304_1_plen_59_part_01